MLTLLSGRSVPEAPAIPRPWGGYTVLHRTRTAWVKKLMLSAGARTSLQRHRLRTEVWYVLSGTVEVQVGSRVGRHRAGDTVCVPRGVAHRLCALSAACVLEVAFGAVREGDIERLADDYGRVGAPMAPPGARAEVRAPGPASWQSGPARDRGRRRAAPP